MQITFDTSNAAELAAVAALIASLRGAVDPVMPELWGNGGLASSAENGLGSQLGTSATVPTAPVVPNAQMQTYTGGECVEPAPWVYGVAETIAAMAEARAMGEAPYPGNMTTPDEREYPVPTPPAPPVPAAPPVVPPPPAGSIAPATSVELDAEGLPWDARIHASTREKAATGKWRARRNTSDEVHATVRAELRQVLGAPQVTIASYHELPADATPGEVAAAFAGVQTQAPALFNAGLVPSPMDVPPPPTVAVPVPPAPTASSSDGATSAADTVMALIMRITAAQAAGQVTIDQTQAAATGLGLTSIRDLMLRPDLVPAVSMALFGE